MKAKIITTSKDGFQVERDLFSTLEVPGARQLYVSEEPVNGYCKFGVAITPSSCYELSLMEQEERTKLLKQIYSKEEGIGLSVARLCIGSCDYSPELYSYDDVAFDTELKHFSVARDEAYVIPMIKEILAINPELTLYASPWSPPYWMKTGESMCGGYMRSEFVECYADYIVKFIKAYAEHGIKISAVTPQNEPETGQGERMAACIWHPEIEAAYIVALKKKLKENGLPVEIWMYDHTFLGVRRVSWSLDKCAGLRESCDGIAFHYYSGAIEFTKVLREKYPELALHFTEGGPRITDNYETDWCKWGLLAMKAINLGYVDFTGWNLMLNEVGGPHIGPFMGICGGFVTNDHIQNELRYSGQYKAFSHIVPHMQPGVKCYAVSAGDSFQMNFSGYGQPNMMRQHSVEGVLIEKPNGEIVVILVNPNEWYADVQFSYKGEYWYYNLAGESISTLVLNK